MGGIGPSLKIIHRAECFNMDCEVHGGGAGNLTLCAVKKNRHWYERGLLHPFIDFDAVPEYLNSRTDAMDGEGFQTKAALVKTRIAKVSTLGR